MKKYTSPANGFLLYRYSEFFFFIIFFIIKIEINYLMFNLIKSELFYGVFLIQAIYIGLNFKSLIKSISS